MQKRKLIAPVLSAITVAILSMSAITSFAAAPVVIAQAEAPNMTLKAAVAIEDSVITAKVKSALVSDKEVSALKINVATKGGVVILTGAIPSAAAGDRVVKMVAVIEGVKDIQSELQVKG